MRLGIHAIVLALNEEVFIANQLRTLYPFCSGISVLTQYDRDWYGKSVQPDDTVKIVANYPDPEGKIHLVIRRFRDETAARNSEMIALTGRPDKGIMSHGTPMERIRAFHAIPDYFWLVDADEFYDPDTVPAILDYLASKRPSGMRVHGFNYVGTWNRRVPSDVVSFCQFGFIRPGLLFECRRTITWNESRVAKALHLLRLPDFSARLFGFIECPKEVGVFHHGCWIGPGERLAFKAAHSSHREIDRPDYPDEIGSLPFEFVPLNELPRNIRDWEWPPDLFEPEARHKACP